MTRRGMGTGFDVRSQRRSWRQTSEVCAPENVDHLVP